MGGCYCDVQSWAGTDPGVKILRQAETPGSALFQRGLCCNIGLAFLKLDSFLKNCFLKELSY